MGESIFEVRWEWHVPMSEEMGPLDSGAESWRKTWFSFMEYGVLLWSARSVQFLDVGRMKMIRHDCLI